MTEIRLACLYCDRDDFDGIKDIPGDWSDVGEERHDGKCGEWWTHLGVCPDCQGEVQ